MQYIVTEDEMREYDNNTIEKIGIPSMVLMERAALAVRDAILAKISRRSTVLIVTGSGNNGADGLALARLLAEEDYNVTVCPIGERKHASQQYLQQLAILRHYSVDIWKEEIVPRMIERIQECPFLFDVIVDAVFGVGLSREVRGHYAEAIKCMNSMNGYKVAVDISSGISADDGSVLGVAFQADLTVTFGFAKRGMYFYPGADCVGQLVVADIGITNRAFFGREPEMYIEDESFWEHLPKRKKDGNKGTFGKILVIAGFEKMVGAAVLSARAALEMGAGMVKVLCPETNRSILQSAVPEVLYGTCDDLENSLKWADVVVVGPGMGQSEEAQNLLLHLLRMTKLSLVIDADALNMLSASDELKALLKSYAGEKILTPHIGELARLCGQDIPWVKEHRIEVAKSLSKEYHCVMVCKDARTLIAGTSEDKNEHKLYLNVTGNNGMATAGSGDVLTGIIGAFLAQNQSAMGTYGCAVAGVYLHGLAGDDAGELYTEYGVTASRLIENIREINRDCV